jgi:hypothetical protein
MNRGEVGSAVGDGEDRFMEPTGSITGLAEKTAALKRERPQRGMAFSNQ